jgi:hypothetical protein
MGSLLSVPEVAFRVEGLSHQRALWRDLEPGETAIVGPLGCGKSYALAIKQLILRRVNAGVDGMLVTPTFTMARMIHIEEWPKIWEDLGIKVKYESQRQAFLWPWGDRTWIRSAENPARLAGPNLGDVTFDEPGQISREAYERGSARARHPKARVRRIELGGTPEGINFFADLFSHPKGDRRTIWGRAWPKSLASFYPQRLVDLYGYDDSLLDAYGRGKFVPLRVGRCYKPFDRAKHQEQVPRYDPSLPLMLACDFNVDAMRWEIGQMTTTEIRYLDEIALGRSGTTAEAAEEFVYRWGNRHRGEVIVTGDAAGAARSTSGQNDYQILRETLEPRFRWLTFNVPKANPRQKDRVDQTNYHLAGRGMTIHIAPHIEELTKDWERVSWKKGQIQIDKSDPDRTHASDAADYMIWQLARVSGIGGPTIVHEPEPQFEGGFATMDF